MKKVLLSTAAIAGLAMVATPAAAQVSLELGGYFKGYGMYTDQDDDSANTTEARDFDIIRNTEVHFGGETTLDNGLTVGAHMEFNADATGGADNFASDESYVYFSGGWGRVNVGSEDGAAYLLQVAAPSADSNLDGIRQFVNPFNYTAATTNGTVAANLNVNGTRGGLDYDQDVALKDDKITYLSPIMNGFQLGVSFTPEHAETNTEDATNTDDGADDFGSVYEAAVRYEGMFNNAGIILGAGYTHAELEADTVGAGAEDDRTAWNIGADVDLGPFGIGIVYAEDDYGEANGAPLDDDEETLVIGVDYTTGPFKLGASYMNMDNAGNLAGNTGSSGVEADRYAAGVIYTYGPGMTFRGSISHVELDNVATVTTGDEIEATSILLGTQINF